MKPVVRYQMNFSGKWLTLAAFFSGLSFFLSILYFYVFGYVEELEGSAMFFGLVFPLVVLGVGMLLLKLFKLDIPMVYAGATAAYCLCVAVTNFSGGPGWMNVVEIIWYVLCAAAMVFSLLGYFKGKWYLVAAFFAAAIARFFFRDFLGYFDSPELVKAIPDASVLCGMLWLTCLWAGLKARNIKRKNAERA